MHVMFDCLVVNKSNKLQKLRFQYYLDYVDFEHFTLITSDKMKTGSFTVMVLVLLSMQLKMLYIRNYVSIYVEFSFYFAQGIGLP